MLNVIYMWLFLSDKRVLSGWHATRNVVKVVKSAHDLTFSCERNRGYGLEVQCMIFRCPSKHLQQEQQTWVICSQESSTIHSLRLCWPIQDIVTSTGAQMSVPAHELKDPLASLSSWAVRGHPSKWLYLFFDHFFNEFLSISFCAGSPPEIFQLIARVPSMSQCPCN